MRIEFKAIPPERSDMARTDAIVLGAGIVGTSIALHLVKRGLSVALLDWGEPGEQTSYGNAGIIEGNTIFPPAFPRDPEALLRVALKRAPEANYHFMFLPRVARWLIDFYNESAPARLAETARLMRPLFARALPEHEALMEECGATRYLRKNGWIKVYRSDRAFAATEPERALAANFGIPLHVLDVDGVRALEPSIAPIFRNATYWEGAASVSNPLAVTQAFAKRFVALGGVILTGDARSLHPADGRWRVDTAEGHVDTNAAIVALGPWAPDLLEPLGIRLPLAIKRGYHRHFEPQGNASLARPVVDVENGYCLAPMEQGIRLTTGAEFAARDAPPTPVQLDRLLPDAKTLFPLGQPLEAEPWLGRRPCFADSRPVIGPAPGQRSLWLAYGHGHWGLTLGPVTGRLIAEMITGATPFCDPKPYSAERFGEAATGSSLGSLFRLGSGVGSF
jgi:D-amino-acid dehydrogenase